MTLAEHIKHRLVTARTREKEILGAGHRALLLDEGRLYVSHFFLLGAVKKAVATADGFLRALEDENFTCAAALLRLYLDAAVRFSAVLLVDNPEALASDVFGGTRLDRLKDRNGQRLTDKHLIEALSATLPWVKSVYEATSGFVHLSERHIFASLIRTDDDTRQVEFLVCPSDPHVPEASYDEALAAFDAITDLLLELLSHWQDPSVPAAQAGER